MTVPHCTLEYSANLTDFAAGRMLAALNAGLLASGLFAEADIKSRAIRLEQFAVGVVPAPRAFVHLTLSVLSGRSTDERAALARQALAVLEAGSIAPAGTELQLSVDVAEMERATYAKAVRHA
ncbi:5-carboxymethyl-2-hydroxymuconate isomerase [Laribacter hongkongensis]|uniref:5-carboxymethyl-2-hydroxymuconate Delta-isomerase n=1 Tax=Laribacter hongkongensis TaxID=168471 RepID=UPI001EFDBB4F|nr:5-carboxymethyl-2-hydroxymuconate isomerase [Laribacter hongkongensis]MCG9004159.1 5-carboxymethyl-2-hydroxymuconate isomerase [Laribacter hongkongensis]MCG9013448.1 5-carboxymethyl-2-hydroxymuconate isomerase [Laribacter hongkongensis]MCG9019128.1 5-carboxymethyl-2-hydroxymuconate isomerase [Laribacter hongkongensis]MCG9035658.1 5-carboxymethyl-2-hydroxymuconate isomerase [Laribacter hongkongensis]MCG9043035.1 5-carboxymethyl-2-hydroxymuconate isomerase [Laribacter hongkongensis]